MVRGEVEVDSGGRMGSADRRRLTVVEGWGLASGRRLTLAVG